MYNQQSRKREAIRYQIIAAEECEPLAKRMEEARPDRFTFHKTTWGKFPDGTDNIEIGGFYPQNVISGEHVLFLASFHNNDVTLSQFQVMICLLQSFIESLTVVLPYSPVGKSMRYVAFYQLQRQKLIYHILSNTFDGRHHGARCQRRAGCHSCNLCAHVLIAPKLWKTYSSDGL
jgi:phosphoribosylpyrophosphate synthetase